MFAASFVTVAVSCSGFDTKSLAVVGLIETEMVWDAAGPTVMLNARVAVCAGTLESVT